ncbi:MAG: DNA-binding protein [Alphaproteobacteria bacterium]|nr:DNA-binding protein [Alphaproteobacteria bacterium]
MNKQELAAFVAKQAGITAAAAQKAIDATCEGITTSLQKGDDVRLVGFGTFTRTERAAREGRNPQTGDTLKIAASFQAKFKAGKALKDTVNGTTAKKKKAA